MITVQGESDPNESSNADVIARLLGKFDLCLEHLSAAKTFAKSTYQTDVFQIADTLIQSDRGIRALYSRAHLFEEMDVFLGGPWVDSSKLQPPLVAGSLKAGGVYPVVETLSELRMLALATKKYAEAERHQEALTFMNEVMALNLEFIFPRDTEEDRIMAGPHRETCIRLFELIAEELGLSSLCGEVVWEIEQICAQRPVMTRPVCKMISMAANIPVEQSTPDIAKRLNNYVRALHFPSILSKKHPEPADYRNTLKNCDTTQLKEEALAFAEAMQRTGLNCTLHAVLLRHLRAHEPELIPTALGLNELGRAELAQNRDFVDQLIKVAVLPATAQCIYGFSKILELGLLSRQEINMGLSRLIDLDLQPEVKRNLLTRRKARDGVTANSCLLAGMIAIFGQPLGVGQGNNPTCQAARGISLWAQHAHGFLLGLLISAARDGYIQMDFEGENLRSDVLPPSSAPSFDDDLDPVSLILVPHLDRLYEALMKRVALRHEDGHKWVNPALYGRWIGTGFASVFSDRAQTTVRDYDEFLRRFYATHHPAYNDDHPLMYPNPVGILVTNSHGDCLGPHAVSLQRIAEDSSNILRVYFFNPNNEGRQDWGHGVKPSVHGNGELEGESSLPFHDFAARLYAFHYNPCEEGDAYAVPFEVISSIESAARNSWGKSYSWIE